jgi:hypothetical protein
VFKKLFENLKMGQFENSVTVNHLHNFQIFKLSNYLINSVLRLFFEKPEKSVLHHYLETTSTQSAPIPFGGAENITDFTFF